MSTTKRTNGVTLWAGPSPIDGAPIAVILTGLVRKSANRKTGPVLQTWIIRTDVLPTEAVKSGKDVAICGDCPLRGIMGKARACYVNVGQAPQAIYRAYKRGAYPKIRLDPISLALTVGPGRAIRFGAYGDPAMAPLKVWGLLANQAKSWTGYTHQWRTLGDGWKALLMASTDAGDRDAAQAQGWRTFTVTAQASPEDVACPAAQGLTTCDKCSLCSGTASGARSVTISPHGSGAKFIEKLEMAGSV